MNRLIVLIFLFLCVNILNAEVTEIKITPQFETAGIIVKTTSKELSLEIKKKGSFVLAHPFVRFDAGHMAASLFYLKPNTTYEIRIDKVIVKSFRTRKVLKIPGKIKRIRLNPGDSIQKAIDKALPGTEIILSPGRYRGSIHIFNKKGTAIKPIIIRGVVSKSDMSKTIDKRKLVVVDMQNQKPGIYINESSHVIIDSIRVEGAKDIGVRFSNSQFCTLQNSQIYDNGIWHNILISKGGESQHHITVSGNHIADLKHNSFKYGYQRVEDVTYYGISCDNNSGWGLVIKNNLIEHHIDGISTSGDEDQCQRVLSSNQNILDKWPTREIDVYDNKVIHCRDDGIETDGICVNQRIFRNYFSKCNNPISISPSLPGPFIFLRNICKDYHESAVKFNTKEGRGVIRNIYFYHNNFLQLDKKYILNLWDGTPSKNIVFRNNIFTGQGPLVHIQKKHVHKPDFDYNLWFSVGRPQVTFESNWKKPFRDSWVKIFKYDQNGIYGNPRLSKNGLIKSGSIAIDKACVIPGINDGYKGKLPDIGSVELK